MHASVIVVTRIELGSRLVSFVGSVKIYCTSSKSYCVRLTAVYHYLDKLRKFRSSKISKYQE